MCKPYNSRYFCFGYEFVSGVWYQDVGVALVSVWGGAVDTRVFLFEVTERMTCGRVSRLHTVVILLFVGCDLITAKLREVRG